MAPRHRTTILIFGAVALGCTHSAVIGDPSQTHSVGIGADSASDDSTFPASIKSFGPLPPQIRGRDGILIGGDTMIAGSMAVFQARDKSVDRPEMAPRIYVRVISRDTTVGRLHWRPIAFAECPIELRLATKLGANASWRSTNGSTSCGVSSRDSASASASWKLAEILGDSLPSRHYYVQVFAHLADGRTYEAATDSLYLTSDPRPPANDLSVLSMSASASVGGRAPKQLRGVITLRNTSSRAVAFNYGACSAALNLFTDSARTHLAWASARRGEYIVPPPKIVGVCILALFSAVIPPHDSMQFRPAYPLGEVIADSLPAGRYFVEATLSLNTSDTKQYKLDAGSVSLSPTPDSLPRARIKNGVLYRARTFVVRGTTGDIVRTLVLAENNSRDRREIDIAADCPVTTYFYSRPLRFDLPEQIPSASGSRKCSGVAVYRFVLGVGQSWVFGQDVQLSDLRKSLPDGKYWIQAFVPGPEVKLSGGTVDIRN